jgi:hypothetical protein
MLLLLLLMYADGRMRKGENSRGGGTMNILVDAGIIEGCNCTTACMCEIAYD